MKTVAIIQARMGSTRLPGKVMANLGGRPALERVIARVARAQSIDGVMVATTALDRDDVIEEHSRALGVAVCRGHESDVLARYEQAATASGADLVVRITSDCPLVDPEIVDRVVSALSVASPGASFASNVIRRTFPRGLDVEAIWRVDLARLAAMAVDAYDREHVFPYVYRHPGEFVPVSIEDATDRSMLRWTLDTREDLAFLQRVWGEMKSDTLGWRDVLALVERHPEWAAV